MPRRLAWLMTSLLSSSITSWVFLEKLATRWLISVRTVSVSGKIFLTAMMLRRRHGQAGYQTGPQGGRACRGPLPEPAPGAGDRPGVPGQRLLRRPGRGAGQVRDGAQGQGRRRPGDRGCRGVRVLPAGVLRRGRRAGVLGTGRAGAGQARAAQRQQAHRGDPHLGRGAAGRRPRRCARRSCRTGSGTPSACACTPARSSERWPAAASATPKAAELPAPKMRKEDNPSLSLLTSPGYAAAEPGTSLDAGQDSAPGGGLDARYEQLRHAALHTRAEAFPLGLGVLARGGVTAWRHALAGLAPAGQGQPDRPARGPPRPPGSRSRWPPSSSASWRPSRSPELPPARSRSRRHREGGPRCSPIPRRRR